MAPVRSKATIPVGSARWVFDERKQVVEFGDQEAEDFAFSARNEVEWLNEHMADIFSNNQLYDRSMLADGYSANNAKTEMLQRSSRLLGSCGERLHARQGSGILWKSEQ